MDKSAFDEYINDKAKEEMDKVLFEIEKVLKELIPSSQYHLYNGICLKIRHERYDSYYSDNLKINFDTTSEPTRNKIEKIKSSLEEILVNKIMKEIDLKDLK